MNGLNAMPRNEEEEEDEDEDECGGDEGENFREFECLILCEK